MRASAGHPRFTLFSIEKKHCSGRSLPPPFRLRPSPLFNACLEANPRRLGCGLDRNIGYWEKHIPTWVLPVTQLGIANVGLRAEPGKTKCPSVCQRHKKPATQPTRTPWINSEDQPRSSQAHVIFHRKSHCSGRSLPPPFRLRPSPLFNACLEANPRRLGCGLDRNIGYWEKHIPTWVLTVTQLGIANVRLRAEPGMLCGPAIFRRS